ncbi:MAG TPA: hypothetical protein VLF61_02625, partial [Rhabdochlamydiaceae bacterium]|nr:hypothetical protein [Rhabdochlamydiaceae bacterium]
MMKYLTRKLFTILLILPRAILSILFIFSENKMRRIVNGRINRIVVAISALICPGFLVAESPPSSISSTHASYNGNKLFLEGDVKLDHEFGQMAASEAYLEKDEKLKDLFSLIHLQKNVLLNFKNHGQMLCDIADLNFQTMKGKFFPKPGERIIYTELLEKMKGGEALLKLNSELAELKLSKNEKDYQIDEIEALKNVLVEYGQDFALKAARALFQQKEKWAMLLAYSADDTFCTLSHLGDTLHAKFIEFDLKQLKLILHSTHGVLESVLFPQFQKEQIK